MPRPYRIDRPDRWYHSWNRSVAQRPIFETPRDMRFFLSRIAWMVKDELIEVHAFCIMANHFHLLVRSVCGRLSDAMKWIQEQMARYFNRTRLRDGPIFRGRFGSREVRSAAYWEGLLLYIDNNPVDAGLVVDPALYPWGSASFHSGRVGAPWLSRDIVERIVVSKTGSGGERGAAYKATFSASRRAFLLRLIADRVERVRMNGDPLDFLVDASDERTRDWLLERARNADGNTRPLLLVSSETLLAEIAARLPAGPVGAGGVPDLDQRHLAPLKTGLLRSVAGLSRAEVSLRIGRSESAVTSLAAEHDRLLCDEQEYLAAATQILRACIETDIGECVSAELLSPLLRRA